MTSAATPDVAIATQDVAIATQDVAPSIPLPAPSGEPIRGAVSPSAPASSDAAPAATGGAGGLAGGGGVPALPDDVPDHVLVAQLVGARLATEADFARVNKARMLAHRLAGLLAIPDGQRGRREMARKIAAEFGFKTFQHVYRLLDLYKKGGLMALARLGQRRDRGQARVLVSAGFEAWADSHPALGEPQALAEKMLQLTRAAWVGGAAGATQAWLKATAALAKELMDAGHPREAAAELLSLPCPRRFVEAEGKKFRVAGVARRDGKRAYDHHMTPVQRTAAGLMPGDLVCGDISPLDIPVARPDGSVAYARMIAWHDVATNWLHVDLVRLDKGEGIRREHVAASFCRMCETAPFGAPRHLYLDNGSEYKWEELIQAWVQVAMLTKHAFRVDEAGLLPEQARVTRSIPFHPRGKRIEGRFGNLHQHLAWWLGYVGGNRMAKKITTLGKGVEVSDFSLVEEWLKLTLDDYHATPQQSKHMKGLSPMQALERARAAGWKKAVIEREILMLAFADREQRRINRGAINYMGRTWFHDELMAIEGRVEVAYPRIASPEYECLIVLDLKGQPICIAQPQESYGMLDQAGAKEAARRRKAFRLLVADREKEAGGALDGAALAGVRAKALGLEETLSAIDAEAIRIEPSPEAAALRRKYLEAVDARLKEQARRAAERAAAENLIRWAEEDEDTKAARAMGF